jgi:tetratricopeptide (TPR) repeat protein
MVAMAILLWPRGAPADSADRWFARGRADWRQGRKVSAEKHLTHAIVLRPDWARALALRGRVRISLGKYRAAAADLTRAIGREPGRAEYHAARADAWVKLRRLGRAEADYSRAIRLRPRYLSYRLDRAGVYLRRGDFRRAIIDYSRVIRGRPRLAKAYYNRGLAFYRWGRMASARRDFTRSLDLKPTHQAYNQRGNVHLRQGRFRRAEADYRQGLKLAPRQARLWSNLCGALVAQKKHRQALPACGRAISLNPRLRAARHNLAAARRGLARPAGHGPPAERPRTGPPRGWYAVQVGSFRHRDNALRLAARLRRRFGSAWILTASNGRVHRVLVTASPSRSRARRQVTRLRRAGFQRAFAVKIR